VEIKKPVIQSAPTQPSTIDPDRRAAEAVLALGGSVNIRFADKSEQRIENTRNLPTKPFELLRIRIQERPKVKSADLEPIRSAAHLIDVGLFGIPVGDAMLERLQNTRAMEILNLDQAHVTDEGLSYLKRMKAITWLNLTGNSGVTDAGMAKISR